MRSTDHFLAEVKVPDSAPWGPPRHSSLPVTYSLLIRKQTAPILWLLIHTRTLTDSLSVQEQATCWMNEGLADANRQIWAGTLAVALFI